MIVEAQVPAAVRLLPIEVRVPLMLGPIAQSAPEDVGDCRVCEAIERWWEIGMASTLAEEAAVQVYRWHQGGDLACMAHGGFTPGQGAEVYRRCCVIYEAAGWRGPETVVLGPHEAIRSAG